MNIRQHPSQTHTGSCALVTIKFHHGILSDELQQPSTDADFDKDSRKKYDQTRGTNAARRGKCATGVQTLRQKWRTRRAVNASLTLCA